MDAAIRKAEVLIEALDYIRTFRDRQTVIKLGGSAMEDPVALRNLAIGCLPGNRRLPSHSHSRRRQTDRSSDGRFRLAAEKDSRPPLY